MGLIVLARVYGFAFIGSYNQVIAMGMLLGIAGASFGVALGLGSGWYPPQMKDLAMGIAGAGNSGTVLAVLFLPPWLPGSAGRPFTGWLPSLCCCRWR